MKLLENINLDTVNISRIETIIKQQNECLLEMYKLLLFDETTDEPDNNKWAKAFLEYISLPFLPYLFRSYKLLFSR